LAFEGCLEFFDGPEALMAPPEGWAHLSKWGPGYRTAFTVGAMPTRWRSSICPASPRGPLFTRAAEEGDGDEA
jgi:hypothetical protein